MRNEYAVICQWNSSCVAGGRYHDHGSNTKASSSRGDPFQMQIIWHAISVSPLSDVNRRRIDGHTCVAEGTGGSGRSASEAHSGMREESLIPAVGAGLPS